MQSGRSGKTKSMTYAKAGVDLDRYDVLMKAIKGYLGRTTSSGKGLFGGTLKVKGKDTILVATVDGVGTKTKVAASVGNLRVIGQDIVCHCVNDILAMGAKPLAFLDYLAFDRLDLKAAREILAGMAYQCRRHGVELIGGETAEMPGVYRKAEFDVVGFMIGLTSERKMIDGSRIKVGDLIVGLPSTGLHTNGYSLARKVLLEKARLRLDKPPKGWKQPLGKVLLKPHRSYFADVYPLVERRLISGIAHITGGGIPGNLKRILPQNCNAIVVKSLWRVPPVFNLIAELGGIEEEEMLRVFNMGLGMLLIVPYARLPQVMTSISSARIVGEVVEGQGEVIIQ